ISTLSSFHTPAPPPIYPLSLHDALPISQPWIRGAEAVQPRDAGRAHPVAASCRWSQAGEARARARRGGATRPRTAGRGVVAIRARAFCVAPVPTAGAGDGG